MRAGHFFILSILVITWDCALAQHVTSPSFLKELSIQSDEKIKNYFDSLSSIKLEDSETVYAEFLEYAKENNHPLIATLSNRNLGEIYADRKELPQAITYLQQAAQAARAVEEDLLYGEILIKESTIYDAMGKKNDALEQLLKAYKTLIAVEPMKAAQVQYHIANLNYSIANPEGALKHAQLARRIFNKFDFEKMDEANQSTVMHLLNTLGIIHRELNNYDSALYYLNASKDIAERLNNEFWINLTLGNMGSLYIKLGEYQKALDFLKKDLYTSKKYKEWASASYSAMSIGEVYSLLEDYEMAKIYYDSALYAIGKPMKDKNNLRAIYYRNLSAWHKNKAEFEQALKYYVRFTALLDTLRNREQDIELARIKTNYDFDSKLKEIELLTENNNLQSQKIKYRNIIIIASAIAILAILVVVILLYKNLIARKRDNNLLAEQKERIESQSEQLSEQNRVIQIINDNLELEVEKRTDSLTQLNKELDTFLYRASHDIRQPIATILGLENLAKKYASDSNLIDILDRLKATANRMDDMLRKLQMSYEVNHSPGKIGEIELHQFTRRILEHNKDVIIKKSVNLQFQVERQAINSNSELLAIVIHNIIENALIYTNGTTPQLNINGRLVANEYRISIADNGEGIHKEFQSSVFNAFFKASASSKGNGLGLYLAWKASSMLGMKIELKSELNKGSEFILHIPTL